MERRYISDAMNIVQVIAPTDLLPDGWADIPESLWDLLPAAVYVCDRDGKIVRYNRRAAELWGRTPEIGNPSERFNGAHRLYQADGKPLADVESPMADVLRTGKPVRDREVIVERPDGSRITALVNITALRDETGAVTGAINCFHDISERKRVENQLRASQDDLSAELEATQLLQAIGSELIHDQASNDLLYHKLAEAAAAILRSDFASMQMLYPERGTGGELHLLASRGFDPGAVKFWEWVRADSGCTCGEALRTRQRAIASDVKTCAFMAGTPDRDAYLQAGMQAAQSTPLISRDGRLLGMLSTHWCQPHQPGESELRRFDILARQAADVIERAQITAALRESETRFRSQVEAFDSTPLMTGLTPQA